MNEPVTVEAAGPLARSCSGCGAVVTDPAVARCPAAVPGDDIDHLVEVPEPEGPWPGTPLTATVNPFVRYRRLAWSWWVGREGGLADAAYVDLVEALDTAVSVVDGRGFRPTPLVDSPELAAALGLPRTTRLLLKDETGNVSGSHKARHLFGVAVHRRVLEALGAPALGERPLAIASCGNAALGAAVVAAAAGWRLAVYVPPWADARTLERLADLGARVHICERHRGEQGDPCVLRYREAVAGGARPFTTQGPEDGITLEGGATLAYELADQVASSDRPALDRLYVQVGGGALASSLVLGLRRAVRLGPLERPPELFTVQAASGAPLARAYARVEEQVGAGRAPAAIDAALHTFARHRSEAMWPWEPPPRSLATGILDDETYDWRRLVQATLADGGRPVLVTEDDLGAAHRLARDRTGVDADATGTAGLAGVLADARQAATAPPPGTTILAVLTGVSRRPPGADAPSRRPGGT